MANKEQEFHIELSSSFDGWWRYNIVLMCGCFDATDSRTGFTATESHIADIGSNLMQPPVDTPHRSTISLHTAPCDHIVLYLYIIPHSLPAGKSIDSNRPFDVELKISYAGEELRSEKRHINQWSGTSVEIKIQAPKS